MPWPPARTDTLFQTSSGDAHPPVQGRGGVEGEGKGWERGGVEGMEGKGWKRQGGVEGWGMGKGVGQVSNDQGKGCRRNGHTMSTEKDHIGGV